MAKLRSEAHCQGPPRVRRPLLRVGL